MSNTIALVLILFTLLSGCAMQHAIESGSSWQLVFQNDVRGKTLRGSRNALSTALKGGSPLRVAWGERSASGESIVMFVIPDVISIVNDTVVVVQFSLGLDQTSYADINRIALNTPPQAWRGLAATDGRFESFLYDIADGTILRKIPQHAVISWYAMVPVNDLRMAPELAVPGGLQRDPIKQEVENVEFRRFNNR